MSTKSPAPADTRMMGVVHDALRRDLSRATRALSADPGSRPEDDRAAAIGEHVSWMMAFLHAHHRGENAGVWPLVRDRDPEAGRLLEQLEAEHTRIDPLVDACDDAARGYRETPDDDEARAALLDALTRLSDALLPHLRREEDELLPLVSVAVSDTDLRAMHHEYFIKPKSLSQLGMEGHWLLDGLDAERRHVLLRGVSAIPRFVLVHGFRRRYRRQATACWGQEETAGKTRRRAYGPEAPLPPVIPHSSRVETVVPAPIDAVWQVVSDVTRVGEWSRECRHVEWSAGATKAAPGVRFHGISQAGPWKWTRHNEILVADEPHSLVWRTVPTLLKPDSSEWRIDLEPAGDGTRIVQSYRLLRAPAVLVRLYSFMVPTHRGRNTELTDDLRRIGEVAAGDLSPER